MNLLSYTLETSNASLASVIERAFNECSETDTKGKVMARFSEYGFNASVILPEVVAIRSSETGRTLAYVHGKSHAFISSHP